MTRNRYVCYWGQGKLKDVSRGLIIEEQPGGLPPTKQHYVLHQGQGEHSSLLWVERISIVAVGRCSDAH